MSHAFPCTVPFPVPRPDRQLLLAVALLAAGGALVGMGALAPRAFAQEAGSQPWTPSILRPPSQVAKSDVGGSPYPPYLPNFSFAGYRWGEHPLPGPSGRVLRASEFGAVPDDGKDDTLALQQALRAAHNTEGPVTVQLPPGRLIVKEILFIERGHLVLKGQGQGEDGTTLHFPRPLDEMDVPSDYEEPLPSGNSQFSWQGGVIWTRMPDAGNEKKLTNLVAGRRGHHVIKTEAPTALKRGDVVQIRWHARRNGQGSFLPHMYCSTNVEFGRELTHSRGRPEATQEVTVLERNGRTIRIKEPLLHDLRRYWKPALYTDSFLYEVGIQDLRVVFPDVPYGGRHLEERGYNAIYLTDLAHSWVDNVYIQDSDSGVLTEKSKNVTVSGVNIEGRRGHYSLKAGNAYGLLFADFDLGASDIHNPSANTFSRYSVFTNGEVDEPRLDQHRGANHQILFDDLETVYFDPDDRLFRNGGGSPWRPTAGAFNTFWNVRVDVRNAQDASRPFLIGRAEGAPAARIVGLRGNIPFEIDYGPDPYVEGLNREGLDPPSLYRYQLRRRLSGRTSPALAIYNPMDGYRVEPGATTPVEASLSGDFEAREVRFYATRKGEGERKEIGRDRDGSDGWQVTWTPQAKGRYRLRAVALGKDGQSLPSRSGTCGRPPSRVWVGTSETLLKGNAPNPFRDRTRIRYAIRRTQHVWMNVYDVLGRRVRTLVDGIREAGEHEVTLRASDLASGTYVYRIRTNSSQQTGKVTIVR